MTGAHIPHCNPACTPSSHHFKGDPGEHLHFGNISGYCEACRAIDPPSWHANSAPCSLRAMVM